MSSLFTVKPAAGVLLFILLSGFCNGGIRSVRVRGCPAGVFLGGARVLFTFSGGSMPLRPMGGDLLPL